MGLGLGMWTCLGQHSAPAGGGGPALTLNPSDKDAAVTLSGGNLTASIAPTGGYNDVRATTAKTSGKWYFEILVNSVSSVEPGVGLANGTASLSNFLGADANSVGYYSSGFVGFNGASVGWSGSTYTALDRIGVAMDIGNNRVYFAKNNTWQNSADPAAGTGSITAALTNFFATLSAGNGTGTANMTACFTAASQSFSPPSGYSAIG
jgi:hypothetical protein